MTTKQIANIRTVSQKNINDLAMIIINALEVAAQLDNVTEQVEKGITKNQIHLVNIKVLLKKALETCNQITPER